MATLDDILNSKQGGGSATPAKGTQEWVEQNEGSTTVAQGADPAKGTQEWQAQLGGGDNAAAQPAQPAQPVQTTQQPPVQTSAATQAPVQQAAATSTAPAAQHQEVPEQNAPEEAAQNSGGGTSETQTRISVSGSGTTPVREIENPLPAVQAPNLPTQAQASEQKGLHGIKPMELPPVSSYADIVERYGKKPMTPEELAELEKKNRRKQLLNSIGAGLQSLSNLFFTTQYAPSMYNANDNAVAKTKTNYDKMLEDNKADALKYITMMMNARKADDAAKQAAAEAARQKDKEEQAANQWQLQFEENQRQFNENLAQQQNKLNQQAEEAEKKRKSNEKIANTRAAAQKEAAATRAAGQKAAAAARSGKNAERKSVFSDGKSNVAIHDDVWKHSLQAVFDTLVREKGLKNHEINNYDTASKKEDFVKQHWYKSESARNMMYALSQLDPDDIVSILGEYEDEIEEQPQEESEEKKKRTGWLRQIFSKKKDEPEEWVPDEDIDVGRVKWKGNK